MATRDYHSTYIYSIPLLRLPRRTSYPGILERGTKIQIFFIRQSSLKSNARLSSGAVYADSEPCNRTNIKREPAVCFTHLATLFAHGWPCATRKCSRPDRDRVSPDVQLSQHFQLNYWAWKRKRAPMLCILLLQYPSGHITYYARHNNA